MAKPVISVVMATYNRAALLPRAINSLLSQTFREWELIIVDDGSRDDTVGLVSQFAHRDSRIHYGYQENAGLCEARNAGIAAAAGKYLTFLDSDDEYRPDHLMLRHRYMEENADVDFVEGGVEVTGGAAKVPDMYDPSRMIALDECNIGGTFFMRAGVAKALNGFHKPDYGCDHELMTRAVGRFRIEKVSWPTYIYHRETPDGMCNLAAARS